MKIMHSEVIVVGGGAAGLMAAIAAGQAGAQTLLIEKNNKLGVKILMSGGTRCNITQDTDWQGIARSFGGYQSRFLKFSLASFSPRDAVEFFQSHAVATKTEASGKIFPKSDRALDVRDALVRATQAAGVTCLTGLPVVDIGQAPAGFTLDTPDRGFSCDQLILTSGGQSWPGCGTTGDGYTWLKKTGPFHRPPQACPDTSANQSGLGKGLGGNYDPRCGGTNRYSTKSGQVH